MARGHWGRRTASLVVGAILLTACQSGEPEIPLATIGTSSTASELATPSETDEWAVPDPLTEDYLIRVLNEMEREIAIFDEWVTLSDVGEQPTEDLIQHVRNVFHPDLVQPYVDALLAGRDEGDGYPFTVRPRGQYEATAVVVHRDDPDCPLLEVTWDESRVIEPGGNQREPELMGLEPSEATEANASGWLYEFTVKAATITDAELADELEEGHLCAI